MEHQFVHLHVDYGLGQQDTRSNVEDENPGRGVGAEPERPAAEAPEVLSCEVERTHALWHAHY